MAMRDLIPWSRGRDVAVRRGEDSPFLTLHREMNRLFDDVFRGFDLSPFGSDRFFDRIAGNWPSVEVSETDQEIKVTAELPGLDEKDVQVELANGVARDRRRKEDGNRGQRSAVQRASLRPFRTTHSGRGRGRGQYIRRVYERGADGHAAEGSASAVEGETHRNQQQIAKAEALRSCFVEFSGAHERCEGVSDYNCGSGARGDIHWPAHAIVRRVRCSGAIRRLLLALRLRRLNPACSR